MAGGIGGGGDGPTTTFTTSTTKASTVTTSATNSPTSSTVENSPLFINRASDGLVFDFLRGGPFSDSVVQDAIRRVSPLVRKFAPRNGNGGGGGRTSVSLQSQTQTQSQTLSQGIKFDHEEFSVTTSVSLGPGTIFIGEDQSVPFFVAAGTTNINTNTHAQSFYTEQIVSQTNTIITNTLIYTATGQPVIAQVDLGAIISLIHSALPAALAQRGALQHIADVSWLHRGFYADALYSYGSFNHDLH